MAVFEIPEITDPAIPAFCAKLPQRAAAFRAVARLAEAKGFPLTDLIERRVTGKNLVELRGAAPDQREFGIGYEWTDEQAANVAA